MVDFLKEIQNTDVTKLDDLVKKKLDKIYEKEKKVDNLGFVNNVKTAVSHRGVIPKETRIKYCNMAIEDYSMRTTDYYYEFVKKIKEYNITNKSAVINLLQYFSLTYFGINNNSRDLRAKLLQGAAQENSTTDDEFWKNLDNSEIGDFKGKNVAMCTERAALAQNLLTLFDFNSYYCMGVVKSGDRLEDHCFNIVEAKDEYRIVDTSMPIKKKTDQGKLIYKPFIGAIDKKNIDMVLAENKPLLYNQSTDNDNLNREYIVDIFAHEYPDLKQQATK